MKLESYACRKLSEFPPHWGQVIQLPETEPMFQSEILSYWNAIVSFQMDDEAGIGWFELSRRPFRGNEVECHTATQEALLCFQGAAICLAGDPVGAEQITPASFRAYYLEAGEGIVFAPGTWHALPFPLARKAVFWVIFKKDTPEKDLHVLNLEETCDFGFEIQLNGV
jgi:hypothetical protein